MNEVIELHVLLRNDDYVKQLEQKLLTSEALVAEKSKQLDRLRNDYGLLSSMNIELIDTLKAYGIKPRHGLDGSFRWSKWSS